MNRCTFLGRLTKDPEVRYTQTGKCVTSITIAVNRPHVKDKPQEADFIPVIFWGKAAETVGNYFTKGERILLTGRLQIRKYKGNDGADHWATEIVATDFPEFIETKKDKAAASRGRQDNGSQGFENFGSAEPFDEEIPF